ncbi:YceI family protein [Micromonospora sp. MP36]|nr:YceI family protein [Micromonospora sp. MP36]
MIWSFRVRLAGGDQNRTVATRPGRGAHAAADPPHGDRLDRWARPGHRGDRLVGGTGYPETGPADATATAHVGLGSLAVRQGTGGARPLTDKDRGEIENNARRTLDVDRHPTATFESSRIVVGDDHATISGTLTMHGAAGPHRHRGARGDARQVPRRHGGDAVGLRNQALLGLSRRAQGP